MLKTILFGYRDWAFEIFNELKSNKKLIILDIVKSQEEYLLKCNNIPPEVDFLLFVGWSWIIPASITKNFLCLGIHPSDLPFYRGGSPIQHQIIAGLEKSKVSLMTLSSEQLDAGDIWIKEDLDLTGKNIKEIFSNISKSSIRMLGKFIEDFKNITPQKQIVTNGSYFKRRSSADSKMSPNDFINNDLKTIYNFIRALTDPYPNAYIEDVNGNRLVFKEVEYIENKIHCSESK